MPKAYTIHHWDTFDNETIQIGEADSLEEASAFVQEKYNARLNIKGADRVDIVHKGNVVKFFKTT